MKFKKNQPKKLQKKKREFPKYIGESSLKKIYARQKAFNVLFGVLLPHMKKVIIAGVGQDRYDRGLGDTVDRLKQGIGRMGVKGRKGK